MPGLVRTKDLAGPEGPLSKESQTKTYLGTLDRLSN